MKQENVQASELRFRCHSFSPKWTKVCETSRKQGAFAHFSLFREEQGRAGIGRRNNDPTWRGSADFHFAAFRMNYEIFLRNRRRNGEKWEWGEGRWKITRLRWSGTWLFPSALSAVRQSYQTIKADPGSSALRNAGHGGTTPIRNRRTGRPCGRRSARCAAGSLPMMMKASAVHHWSIVRSDVLWGRRLVNNRRLLFYARKSGYVATYGNKWALYATVEQLLRTNLSTETTIATPSTLTHLQLGGEHLQLKSIICL